MFAPLAVLGFLPLLSPPHARAAGGGPVNVTLNIPADIRDNPCTPGDIVNVSGTLHIVYYVHPDGSGGFHVDQHMNEQGKGDSLTTGVGYLLAETRDESWQASAGVSHTTTLASELVSQAATDNFVMHLQMHTTVNAIGMPTAAVDHWRLDCTG
jgi:hypothetical protein